MKLEALCLGVAAVAFLASPLAAQTKPTADPAAQTSAPASAPSATPTPSAQPPAAAVAPAPAATQPSAPAQTSAPAAAPAASAPSTAATPPLAVAASGPIPPPPPGKGQVVFFRPSSFRGAVIWYNIRENGVALGKLTNGVYFVKVTDPGTHTYTAATENHNVLHLEVDDGETYYVRGSVQMGFFIGEADMTPSDAATFDKAFSKMKLAAPPEAEPAKSGK